MQQNGMAPIKTILTLILLTWRIWWAPNNANKWQMGFNLAFKGLKLFAYKDKHVKCTALTNLQDVLHYLSSIWHL